MEEVDLSQFSEAEIMSMYSNIIESGEQVIIAKCMSGYQGSCSNGRCYCCAKGAGATRDCYTDW